MESRRVEAEAAVRSFLVSAKKDAEAGLDVPLYADGIGLDSLETAELSAVLEDALGVDPFSDGDMPQTIAQILDFYGAEQVAADTPS